MKELRIKLRVLAATYGIDVLLDAEVERDTLLGEPILVLTGSKK